MKKLIEARKTKHGKESYRLELDLAENSSMVLPRRAI